MNNFMNNHKLVNGKLLQTNKKFSQLKQKQKERIITWIKKEIQSYYEENGCFPKGGIQNKVVIDKVYKKINSSGIWIPYYELQKYFVRTKTHLQNKVLKLFENGITNENNDYYLIALYVIICIMLFMKYFYLGECYETGREA